MDNMKYVKATMDDVGKVCEIVRDSICHVYPKYYPTEVVDFFCELHSPEKISEDIADGLVGILMVGEQAVGTGCYRENHITRVYVRHDYQGKGCGSFIMDCLETEIAKHCPSVELDASLPACHLYEKRGYIAKEHCRHFVKNGVVLVYEIMSKPLQNVLTKINYEGKRFVPRENTENGEVDGDTVFCYHQIGTDFHAEYAGGEVKKGFMIGKVCENGELDFYYQHLNQSDEIRAGKCHSIPLVKNGKLEMHEEWQWLNGDCSRGNSIVVEI